MLTYRLQTPYILGAQKKSLLRRFSSTHNICGHMFWLKTIKVYQTDFWRFKDKSFTVVSSILMKEDSYSEPAIRRVEMPCSPEHTKPLETRRFTEPHLFFAFKHKSFATMPRFYAQVICKIATMVLYFGCSKEPSHYDGTTYVLVENI